MNYNKRNKWIGINKANYPISIMENGIEKIIPAIDTTKTQEDNQIKLDVSCFDEYKELFYVIKPPDVQAPATIEGHKIIAERAERNKDKKLVGSKIKKLAGVRITKVDDRYKNSTIIMPKRNHKAGIKRVYKWVFYNVKEKKDYDVKSVKKFCEEKKITFFNNCYKLANTNKEYQGWIIKKELIKTEK